MIWRKASERRIGNYIWWDSEKESVSVLPLLECLRFAISDIYPLDYFLRGIFTDDELAPGGGDPGWSWYRDKQADGSYTYHAWTYEDVSGLDPCEGDYDEATVKFHVYRTLLNFAEEHSERKTDVDEVIERYALGPEKRSP